MENSLPKTDQTPNRFRIAKNVQPSVDGKIVPRSSYETKPGQPIDVLFYPLLKEYGDKIFKMAVKEPSPSYFEYEYFLDNVKIPQSSFQGGSILNGSDDTSLSVMAYQKNKTLYILNSIPEQSFFKYDGVEITGCGSPQPKIACSQYTNNTSGIKYIKVIQHRVDFDGNEPASETVTFPVLNATTVATIVNGGTFTNIINSANTNVLPTQIITAGSNTLSDPYFIGTCSYTLATNDLTVTATETNIGAANIGNYVFLGRSAISGLIGRNNLPMYWTTGVSGNTYNACLIAVKIKSVSPLKLDCTNVKYKETPTSDWKDGVINGSTMAGQITHGFRKMLTVWSSSTLTGNYVLKVVGPAFPEATTSITDLYVDVSAPNTAGFFNNAFLPINVGLNLGDWYDTNTRKIPISSDYTWGAIEDSPTTFLGMTSYQDQILWWNNDIIFFSDPNFGGSAEHPSAGSFIKVGDSEYGRVISVCGTQDFFVVSRERKNYIVNGNLATGNYRIQDIADIEIGSWCNNGLINIKDSVVMINATGVWQIQGGGRVSHLSKQIPKNFSIYDGHPTDNVYDFKLDGFSTFPIVTPYEDTGLDIAFDEYKEFLVFCQRKVAGSPMLVLHTKTGEFYEWVGFGDSIRSIAFLKGVMHYGSVDKISKEAAVLSEMTFSMQQDYASQYPIKVYTTWLTAGEPSLEKQVLQIKMFGYVYPSTDKSINVTHYKDWDSDKKITNAKYEPDSNTQYSHLKRLNSDKALAVSIGFEIEDEDVSFSLDSIEVEFMPIQQGVKR